MAPPNTTVSNADPQPNSRFLSIAPEIRLSILKHALPINTNLLLDPHILRATSYPIQKPQYHAAASLLFVSRQVYNEVTPLLYSSNILTLLQSATTLWLGYPFSKEAMINTKKLEARVVDTLNEIGLVWDTLITSLRSVAQLILNFENCAELLRPLGELMWRAKADQAFTLKLELCEAPWRSESSDPITGAGIRQGVCWGTVQSKMYDLKTGPSLTTIIVKASIAKASMHIFSDYRHDPEWPKEWRFVEDGNKDSATKKYLIWKDMTAVAS